MKIYLIASFILGANAFAGATVKQCSCFGETVSLAESMTQVMTDKKGIQKAIVTVNNGFSPSTINVKAGKPVQLTFDVKNPGCAKEVVFKDLKIRKSLTRGKKTVITFTPKKSGSLSFACQMNMYKGTLIVK